MTRPTNNPNLTDLAAGYILDDLSPEEATSLDQALAETPALHGEIAAFGEAFALLPYDLPLQAPPAGLKAKILSAASKSTAPSRSTSGSKVVPITSGRSESIGASRRTWQRWIPAISTGIAAVAVATIGWNQVQLRQQSQQTTALQQQLDATNTELGRLRRDLQASQSTIAILTQPGSQTYALAAKTANPKNGQLATAQLVAKPGERTVTLVAHALPKLPSHQVYRLWAATATAAKPLYCGQFRQDDSGTAQWEAPSAACTQKPLQLMITLDGPTDPTTAAGPLVMQTFS
jgi:anti-sigma-K factor RskA